MGPVEVIVVDEKKVSCNGNKDSSAHPLIYMDMGEKDNVVCPYCSCYFTTKKTFNTFSPQGYKSNNS